jgi:aspartyl aminopeptidase
MEYLSKVITSLAASHSQYHVIAHLEEELKKAGFCELKEGESWALAGNSSYFVKRNDSSLIAFRVPNDTSSLSFHISAAHSDSPSFKIKPNPITVSGDLMMLQTEPYGGAIYRSWMDRPLSFAGRVLYADESGIHTRLLDIDEDLLDIPSLCIHLGRDVNNNGALDPATDLIPIFGTVEEGFDFDGYISKKAGLKENETLISYDLYLYLREQPRFVGCHHEFLLCPREDDLASVYSSFYGFLDAHNEGNVSMFCCFDNEEVGSLTRQGARSTFLKDVFNRICACFGAVKEEAASRSFLLSIDNGHAIHPNYKSKMGEGVKVNMNDGIVIKYNANQSYTTDGLSSSLLHSLAAKAKLRVQEYTNRADLKGGSTLGNLSNGEISFLSADIGLPQLAMHASNELLGALDIVDMSEFCKEYFSTYFLISGSDILFSKAK